MARTVEEITAERAAIVARREEEWESAGKQILALDQELFLAKGEDTFQSLSPIVGVYLRECAQRAIGAYGDRPGAGAGESTFDLDGWTFTVLAEPTEEDGEDEEEPEEPRQTGDAWSGGFAENH